MDRLERKTNLFYSSYLPEIKEQIKELKESGKDTSELERMVTSLEEQVAKKDYLAADQLIKVLMGEVQKMREEAGMTGSSLFY